MKKKSPAPRLAPKGEQKPAPAPTAPAATPPGSTGSPRTR